MSLDEDRKLIEEALEGERGPDQVAIASAGLAVVAMLLRKNMAYGSSALDPIRTTMTMAWSFGTCLPGPTTMRIDDDGNYTKAPLPEWNIDVTVRRKSS